MFKKSLLRSFAGAVAVGSALTMSLVAGPSVVTSAPEIRPVADTCPVKYPGSVSTTTNVALSRSFSVYGSTNVAQVTVSRDEAGAKAPVGQVQITLVGGGRNQAWTRSLRGGNAQVVLPRNLPASNTYTVRADYNPPSCSIFSGSNDSAYYTVVKARTLRSVHAPDVKRGQNARANVVVSAARPSMFTPRGKVRVVVKRGPKTIAAQVRRVNNNGRVFVQFRKFRPGKYRVVARYFGNGNFQGAQGADAFRVLR